MDTVWNYVYLKSNYKQYQDKTVDLDYATNIDISDDPPIDYVGRYKDKLGEAGYKLACEQNALPDNFETLEYMDFLAQRRVLMANTVKKAFEELCK